MARSIAISWALLGLLLTHFFYYELRFMGFPDGYITPYDRSTMGLLKMFALVCGVQSVCFLWVGLMRRRAKAFPVVLGIMAAVIFIITPLFTIQSCPDMAVCRGIYKQVTGEAMDDGEGG
jgi:uncharacterized membrane protein HdeD (DUF308 family)